MLTMDFFFFFYISITSQHAVSHTFSLCVVFDFDIVCHCPLIFFSFTLMLKKQSDKSGERTLSPESAHMHTQWQ